MRRPVNDERPSPTVLYGVGLLAALALFPVIPTGCAVIAGIDAPVARATDAAADDVTSDVADLVDATPSERVDTHDGSDSNAFDGASDVSDTSLPIDAPLIEASADSSPHDAPSDKPRNCLPGGAYCGSSFDCCSGSCSNNYCD